MTHKVADDYYYDYYDYYYCDYKVIPWIASSKSSDQKLFLNCSIDFQLFLNQDVETSQIN